MNQGDYERRMSGLEALLRPQDLVAYDVLRAGMVAGVASGVGTDTSTGYAILRAYAASLGRVLGAESDAMTLGHPMLYFHSALKIQGSTSRWPALVISAFAELKSYGNK